MLVLMDECDLYCGQQDQKSLFAIYLGSTKEACSTLFTVFLQAGR